MRTSLLSKILFVIVTSVAFLSASSSVFAQVKIGTNPTTIGANNNLEVEASTTGRKTSIDKTTGQVTIQDGTEGAGKVFTSDANGGGSWQQVGPAGIASLPKGKLTGASTTNFTVPFDQKTVTFSTLTFATSGTTQSGNGLKAPVSGYYQVNCSVFFQNSNGCPYANTALLSTSLTAYINGASSGLFSGTGATPRSPGGFSNNLTDLIYLNANDVVTITANTGVTLDQAGCTTNIISGYLSLNYQP